MHISTLLHIGKVSWYSQQVVRSHCTLKCREFKRCDVELVMHLKNTSASFVLDRFRVLAYLSPVRKDFIIDDYNFRNIKFICFFFKFWFHSPLKELKILILFINFIRMKVLKKQLWPFGYYVQFSVSVNLILYS